MVRAVAGEAPTEERIRAMTVPQFCLVWLSGALAVLWWFKAHAHPPDDTLPPPSRTVTPQDWGR